MKKLLCVLLTITMLAGFALSAFAQEKDLVEITMYAENTDGTTAFFDFPSEDKTVNIRVNFNKISNYENIEVKIHSNNDMLEFQTSIVTEDAVTFKTVVGSGKEVLFNARFNREYLGTEYQDKYCDVSILFLPVKTGEIDLTVSAYGIDLEGNKVELAVEFENVITEIRARYEASECQQGDVNCDGEITAADARNALRIAAKLESPEESITKLADMDDSGKVTAADARTILRMAAGLE